MTTLGQSGRVALICANATQVRTFAPVAERLVERGARCIFVSLDPFYRQGATRSAEELGFEVVEPSWQARNNESGFYRRAIPVIWLDVLKARAPVDDLLRLIRPDIVVLGNDFGLIEKLVIARSRALSVKRRVLVQDGRLWDERPTQETAVGRVVRTMKVWMSPLLTTAGFSYLAASRYGEGGCEVICASGPEPAALLSARAGDRSQVVITGQPRYDRLSRFVPRPPAGPVRFVGVFTTPFEADGYGVQMQRAQEALVGELAHRLSEMGIQTWVKPHPRENTERYKSVLPTNSLSTDEPARILHSADVAVIGPSTVVEEAGLVGCPVIVPGHIVHQGRFDALLPDAQLFPRFESLDEAVALIRELDEPTARVRLTSEQRAYIARSVTFDRQRSAGAAVADAILGR